jgi:(1->4)-alpha-D-glucan 1-alpha-D-glucosylmutase
VTSQAAINSSLGSTYRLQLAGVGFTGARSIVGYLHRLGVETLYCSPILAAVPGSTHGYDVIDPTRLDPALGTEEEFERLLVELSAHRMRLLVDIVPNHMATDPANAWWRDVLRLGQASPHAATFDIDWDVHGDRVMIPTLGQSLAETLAARPVTVKAGVDGPVLMLGGQDFPLDPSTAPAPGLLSTTDALTLLQRQHFLPTSWRRAGDEGNYRRFFDIDGLVGVRVEDREVCERTHAFVLDLVADERVAGLRVDHIDGLIDPAAYLSWLSGLVGANRARIPVLLVEKILANDESLPRDWAADGTTGYEFADLAGALFIENLEHTPSFPALALSAKREILATSFGAPLDRLTGAGLAALDRGCPGHDLSTTSIRHAIAELTVHLDVYRTYMGFAPPSTDDSRRLEGAARRGAPSLSSEGRRALSAIVDGILGDETLWRRFAQHWQQLTGAVMAKGVEDTATYRFDGLLGHAEVGSKPDRRGITAGRFLAEMERRQHQGRDSLNATSTHDSKRSEDVRARLYALTEWQPEWTEQVAQWHTAHASWLEPESAITPQMEHLIYQTLIAEWPVDRGTLDGDSLQRIQDYTVKVAREAKTHSSWSDPDLDYERLLSAFVAHLADPAYSGFSQAAMTWSGRLGPPSATTSLSLIVLKTTCPGVPDIYQGTEVWTNALTDPDNRRPVDFKGLERHLTQLPDTGDPASRTTAAVAELLAHWPDGRLKLFVLRTLLHLRRQEPDLMTHGAVIPIEVQGPYADHLVAFARHHRGRWVVALVPRLLRRAGYEGTFALGPSRWADTSLHLPHQSPQRLFNVFTGAPIAARDSLLGVSDVLDALPVAVLLGSPSIQ